MGQATDILIGLDDGHGMETKGKRTPYIEELGRFVHENEFNRAVVRLLDIELRRCGFKTLLVAPTDADTSLQERTKLANSKGADAFISIHYDAMDGEFDGEGKDPEGITVFHHPNSANGKKLANAVSKYLKQGTKQQNRGVKTRDNLHVLNASNMPAILTENGFMDNKREALLMVDVAFQKEVAREHAQGICEYFNVGYIAERVEAKVAGENIIVLTDGQKKDRAKLAEYGIMKPNYEFTEQYEIFNANLQAQFIRTLEKKGVLKNENGQR